MNTEEKIQHIEALNHATHETELFLIKGNWQVDHTYHYSINNKRYKIHLQMKEEDSN